MKMVSGDLDYIDYTADRVGIRVRKSFCRPIILERGRWSEFRVSYSIPVDTALLRSPETGMSSLASNVHRVEESAWNSPAEASELRRLITGKITFESALRSSATTP